MPVLLLFFFLFFLIVFSIILLLFLGIVMMFVTRVPYAPTPHQAIQKIIDELNIQPGQVVYDLGCGDGRFLFAAEKKGARAIGFEISPFPYLRARLKKAVTGSRAKIHYKNFYAAHLFDANVVFCFLVDTVMPRLEKKLQAELQPGTRVVSYGFHFPNWKMHKVILPEPEKDNFPSEIFIYQN